MESLDIKKLVNNIFVKKGLPPVKNFPQEFADGSKLIIILPLIIMIYINILYYSKVLIAF
jgi:hypothetical protein